MKNIIYQLKINLKLLESLIRNKMFSKLVEWEYRITNIKTLQLFTYII